MKQTSDTCTPVCTGATITATVAGKHAINHSGTGHCIDAASVGGSRFPGSLRKSIGDGKALYPSSISQRHTANSIRSNSVFRAGALAFYRCNLRSFISDEPNPLFDIHPVRHAVGIHLAFVIHATRGIYDISVMCRFHNRRQCLFGTGARETLVAVVSVFSINIPIYFLSVFDSADIYGLSDKASANHRLILFR